MTQDHYKICLLGEGRVGKTSLVRKYCTGDYSDDQQSTVQAAMYSKKKVQVEDKMVTVAIWDTAGQERFHALGPIYYRDANGALLVYDITDKDTFDRVKHWVKELKAVVGDDIEMCIAGNKCDLDRNRQVTQEDALEYCKSVGAQHFLTSAKLDKNVSEVFQDLTKRMVKRRQLKGGRGGARKPDGPSGGGGRVKIVEDDEHERRPAPAKKGPCC
eukprot:TRINITY_DN41978_c0_g1_i1.p1 TRINITY_DN41978_c0_g1~~TRINITY_DN41978_c0_g1_i1.p1  ORF type:complete len:215 (-),score=32.45 TRINITY_DN41978_c0_g1_i1:33-677(-)